MRKVFAVSTAVVFLLSACAHAADTADKISKVRIGMTKKEVISVMGKPHSTSATGNNEYLTYRLSETKRDASNRFTKPYFVRLIDGKVESYGQKGDFDSTQKPTVRIETDERIKQDINVKGSGDLYTELKKLKELKESGIITESEFQAQKKKLLEKY